ncbi:DUF885 family protein [Candidatus Uabimicrobium sp. HlEnr_7]|uniref:DUF885 domain-containing protein n=1 Tax=Candidatus Uabimicrobium helgolandensis TaxID=3095367 RepID=UPI0035582B9B
MWNKIILTIFVVSVVYAQEMSESEKINQFFEEKFVEQVDRSPMMQGYLGIKKDQDKWGDLSDAFAKETLEITKKNLKELKETINYSALNSDTKVSYDLFVGSCEQEIADFKYRFHNYPVNQMFGLQSRLPSFLINFHSIGNKIDAEAYISRLRKVKALFAQLVTNLKTREKMGIIPPKFVFAYVIDDSKNIINSSTILDDFSSKVQVIDGLDKEVLIAQAKKAISESVKPGYQLLVDYMRELEKKADTRAGVWKFPNGSDFYYHALKKTTTTNLTAEQIFEIGKNEVARIHGEMEQIMKKVKFKGTLKEFFEFMRSDKQFFYANTDEGRERYLKEAREMINTMKGKLDELFISKPKADLIVKRVESFREKSAGKAFYNRPAANGSRPGIYYVNLYNMDDMPVYQMEALAYHEGVPGHHMQLAIAQEMNTLPKFRKFGGYTAYIEGWGLYSEFIPKEMGFYEDPYSDFGRLAMEIWRACRLVVDTGIHYKKWTREQGIKFYMENTPNPKGDAVKMVERHIVMAGQATAYKIGMIKIIELREKAKKTLGNKFDIREFHEVVIANGAIPLFVLEKYIDEWVASKK